MLNECESIADGFGQASYDNNQINRESSGQHFTEDGPSPLKKGYPGGKEKEEEVVKKLLFEK